MKNRIKQILLFLIIFTILPNSFAQTEWSTPQRFEDPVISADELSFGINGTIKPIDRLVIEPRFNHFSLTKKNGEKSSY